ncbi:MAG TPA: biotin/lipoyl-containing protein, partial [Acidimicrobiia bacterium]
YGFLSENAAFAQACRDAGLLFVGPTPLTIELMGSKVEAKRLLADAGVPVLPGLTVTAGSSPTDLHRWAEDAGYPLLVKAAYGGGGRGMRVVQGPDELSDAVGAAQREAASAFGNGTVFLERFVERGRHVEVQIFGDAFGDVVHLFERECSIQRRHQKVIEESPSPAVDERLRSDLCAAAVAAAKKLEYLGAGTVEFILEPDGRFWFLEVNTRLQVEHPVTELVTGLDLVALQLSIAEGHPLPDVVRDATINGHAIEARLYAEDVAAGFLPVSGSLDRFEISPAPNVRIDAGYRSGSVVSTFYDALLAKVIAWSPNRDDAARLLAYALDRAEIHGLKTNRSLLVASLRHPEFLSGDFDTSFYERHEPSQLGQGTADPDRERVHAVAAALVIASSERPDVLPLGVPVGWRNVPGSTAPISLEAASGQPFDVVVGHTAAGRVLTVDGELVPDLHVVAVDRASVVLRCSGVERPCRVRLAGNWAFVDSPLGGSDLRVIDPLPAPVVASAPGSLLAPLPGLVLRVDVAVGDEVAAGDGLVVIEAMKMEHTVRAPHAGRVAEVNVAPGDQADADAVLLVIDEAGA